LQLLLLLLETSAFNLSFPDKEDSFATNIVWEDIQK
jgi:hypothetical protein